MKEYQIRELVYTLPGTEVIDITFDSKKENHIILKVLSEKDYLKWEYFCEKVTEACNHRVVIKRDYPILTFIFPIDDKPKKYLLDLPVDPKTELEVAIFDFVDTLHQKFYLIEKPKRDTVTVFFKITNQCNINCSYCYETPYRKMVGHNGVLSLEEVDKMTDMLTKYAQHINVIFHGGEPTLAGVDYYRKIMGDIFTKYPYATFHASMQTNSINLDKRWHALFNLCGISLGTSYNATEGDLRYGERADKLSEVILDKILAAKEDNVSMGNIEVLTTKNLPKVKEIYEFYKKIDYSNSFLPIFNEGSAKTLNQDLLKDEEKYIEIVTEYFLYWLKDKTAADDRFASESLLRLYTGKGSVCDHQGYCTRENIAIMSNGNLFPCDRPINERYDLGNIYEYDSMESIYNSPKYKAFENEISEKLEHCKKCKLFYYCSGGCPMRDIEEHGHANIINKKQCKELELNLMCMYRALTQVKFEELNSIAKWLLCINNRLLPKEISQLLEKLNIHDKFEEVINDCDSCYNLSSKLEGIAWQLFKSINTVNPEDGFFKESYSYEDYDGSEIEDHRIENVINNLVDIFKATEKYDS